VTAYTLSTRGGVAYSDSLRLEYGDRIAVTSVHPGDIRAAIHERSAAAGVPLEGAVPAERVERTLVRAGHLDAGIARELGARLRAG
jgi:NAD(P)-dependent dehydrogenase (short-subunit alcohol dehydrogenase family)